MDLLQRYLVRQQNLLHLTFKGAKPFLSKFFGKIPIVGPLIIGIISLLSGEPAAQALFKAMGAALGWISWKFYTYSYPWNIDR